MKRPGRRLFSRTEVAGFWLRHHGAGILAGAALFALVVFLFYMSIHWRFPPGVPESLEQAQVLRFGYYDSRWNHQPVVMVRTSGGEVRQLQARRQALRHCRSGDMITLVRRGSALLVHPRGCGSSKPGLGPL